MMSDGTVTGKLRINLPGWRIITHPARTGYPTLVGCARACRQDGIRQIQTMMRRTTLLGGIATLLATGSVRGFLKKERAALPRGGSIILPSSHKAVLAGEFNHEADIPALIAYRKYRSTLAGSWECDGMIATGHAGQFASLEMFAQKVRGALTTSWSYADLKPGWFGGTRSSFPLEKLDGPHGPELQRELVVHVAGFWDVYDKPARMFAMHHRARGLMIAVWILDSHGGLKKARQMAGDIAGSYLA